MSQTNELLEKILAALTENPKDTSRLRVLEPSVVKKPKKDYVSCGSNSIIEITSGAKKRVIDGYAYRVHLDSNTQGYGFVTEDVKIIGIATMKAMLIIEE